MKTGVYYGKHDVRVEDVPDPKPTKPTDALVRITHACICGSDLWFYRGEEPAWKPGWRTGHEWMGIVEDVGSEVHTVKKGDRVLAPFAYSDGICEFCHHHLPTSCIHGGFWGGDHLGGQAEAIVCPYADGTLVKIPDNASNDRALLKRLMPLVDVMCTGHHAVFSAGTKAGSTVAIIGDGAVGLSAVIAAKRLGADRIIHVGHNKPRLDLGRKLGSTDIVNTRDKTQAIEEVRNLTKGGAMSVAECVGYPESMDTAIHVARAGGTVGYVGVPHISGPIDLSYLFHGNITLRGGVAPVRNYIEEMMRDVLAGKLDPSPVLDKELKLSQLPEGYDAMEKRNCIKVYVDTGVG